MVRSWFRRGRRSTHPTQQVVRHRAADRVHGEPVPDVAVGEAVTHHVEEQWGPVDWRWRDPRPDLTRLEVLGLGPTPSRPCWTLLTAGMSERPMSVPEGLSAPLFAELLINLPRRWRPPRQDGGQDGGRDGEWDDRDQWPLRLLIATARLPHVHRTWLDHWHTVPNGDPPRPYTAGSPYVATLLTPPLNLSPQAARLELPGRTANVLALVPLHADELDLKLRRGVAPLLRRMARAGVGDVLDPGRRSCV